MIFMKVLINAYEAPASNVIKLTRCQGTAISCQLGILQRDHAKQSTVPPKKVEDLT